MNIYILSNREIVKNEVAGNNGENNAEIMQFHFPEQIVGIDMSKITKWIQFHNDNLDLLQMIENDKYSLTDLITQYESVEYQVLLKYNNLVLWKSNIDELDFGESLDIDVTITVDDLSVLNELRLQVIELKKQYEEAIKKGNDDITDLIKQVEDLETKINTAEEARKTAEESRVIAENARVQAESERNQKLADLVKEVENTILKLSHSIDEYNSNAEQQLKKLGDTADTSVSAVLSAKNASIKDIQDEQKNVIEVIGNEVSQSITEFDNHVTAKTTEFNTNATVKTTDFDNNAVAKTTEFNSNVTSETNSFNENATEKLEDFNNNYETKLEEMNSELNVQKITDLQEENKYQNQVINGLLSDKESETVEGDNLTINNCAIAPLKEFKIYGRKINQEIREGYNLANTYKIVSRTVAGIKVINNLDGSISLKGTSTEDLSNSGIELIGRININEENEGFYTVQVFGVPENSENGTINVYYFGVLKDKEVRSNNIESGKTIRIELRCDLGAEIDCTIRPFIIKGSYTAETIPPYEQYGQSPSIDFPSSVEYVEGCQDINHTNKNLFNGWEYGDLDTSTAQKNDNNNSIQHTNFIKVLPNQNYTMSFNNRLTKRWFLLDREKNVISTLLTDVDTFNFTTTQETQYFRVKIVGKFDDKTQLEEGEATEFVPHQSETYPLDLTNRNLLPYPYQDTSKELNGITWTDNGDGSVSAKGIATQDSSFKLYGELSNQKIIKGKYLSGGKNSNEIIRIVTKQNNSYIILANSTGTSTPINLETYQEGYIEIVIKAGTEVDTTFYPMLSNFNTDVYVPYTEFYEYSLYSKDDHIYYDEKLKKYFVHNKYNKVNFDGINNKIASKSSSTQNNQFYSSQINNIEKAVDNTDEKDIYSNYFKKTTTGNLYNYDKEGIAITIAGSITFGFGLDSEIDTIDKANAFFAENNAEVIYPLAEPTDTEITDTVLINQLNKLRKMISYEGTNYITVTSSSGLPVTLKIEYTKSSKIIISRLEDRITKLEEAVFSSEVTTVQETEETPEDEWKL